MYMIFCTGCLGFLYLGEKTLTLTAGTLVSPAVRVRFRVELKKLEKPLRAVQLNDMRRVSVQQLLVNDNTPNIQHLVRVGGVWTRSRSRAHYLESIEFLLISSRGRMSPNLMRLMIQLNRSSSPKEIPMH